MRFKLFSTLLLINILNSCYIFSSEKPIELTDIFNGMHYSFEDNNSILEAKLNLLKKYIGQQSENINAQDSEGYTPVMLAIRGIYIIQRGLNQLDVSNVILEVPISWIKFLISKTTNINHQANNGKTALHIAAEKQNGEAIELLLQKGANKTLKDQADKFARDYIKDVETDSQESQKNKQNLLNILNPVRRKLNFDDKYINFAYAALINKEQIANAKLPIQRTFFSDTDIKSILLGLINSEIKSIYCAIFSFTDNDIASALIEAHKNNILVEVVSDFNQAKTNNKDIFKKLKDAGIPIYIWPYGAMHHKFIIFGSTLDDRNLISNGSYNFTTCASCYNQENILISEDREYISKFYDEFKRLKEQSNLFK